MTDAAALPAEARAVLDFWFGATGTPEHGAWRTLWFEKNAATDRAIAQRFGALIEQALRGELDAWAAQPAGALARIIVLDQFTRNAFRDTPRAFAGDGRALQAARALVDARHDAALTPLERSFAYMPFEHAEALAMQDEAVRLFIGLAAAAPELAESLDYAQRHRAVIARFGRFPHRNAVLGRPSTPEELAFLREPGSRF
jgi:uncharacterized protein (DUF924 family)